MKQHHEIQIVELNKSGTYVSFFDGKSIAEGDTLLIFRPRRHFSRLLPERIIGKVKVVQVEAPGRVRVDLLSGKVFGGTSASRA